MTDNSHDLFGQRNGEYVVPSDGRSLDSCKSCGADLIWTTSGKGKFVPLSVATIEEREGVRYALPHFVDCPHSRHWSKR
jgi:hypothetical protein